MTPEHAKTRHAELVREIRRHDDAYSAGRPLVTDYEYDQLENELKALEKDFPQLVTPDSPTQKVRAEPLTRFKRVKHLEPMLSLDKIQAATHPTKDEEPDDARRNREQDENSLAELTRFDATIRKQLGAAKIEYVLEPKVDGVSISLHYRHGKLALGVTRGDGREGDDITANLRQIRTIPHELRLKPAPALLEVRGEAYIAQKDFAAINAKLAAAGEDPFPNARNATAGTLKQLDSRLVAERPLSAVFYAIGALDGISFTTHAEVLESLKKFGLHTQEHWWVCHGIDEVRKCYLDKVVAHYDEARDLRSKLPYEIDGVVLKVNTLADWLRLPPKARAPGYAIVHKPIPWITPEETVLKDIKVQVGRTGVLTPVAELEPVFVQGSTISRATLHNEEEIHRKDIRIGDTVVIRKAGMVIPEVVEVVKSKRPAGAKPFDLVASVGGKCPACKQPISRDPRYVIYGECSNAVCSSFFSGEDFKNLPNLILSLRQHSDPVSSLLRELFSNAERRVIDGYQSAHHSTNQFKVSIAQALNRIISTNAIYNRDRFQGVTLRSETDKMLKQNPSGPDLVRFNRLLLEDAYPEELSKGKSAYATNDLAQIGKECPKCGGIIVRKVKYADWICTNVAACPAQLGRRLDFFAQRRALDIESLGGIVAEKLVERRLVTDPLDLFELTMDKFASLNLGTDDAPRVFGEKNAAKIVEALNRARSLPLARWLLAFAIADVGEETAYDVGKFFPDFETVARSEIVRDASDYGEFRRLFDDNKVGDREKSLSESEKKRRKQIQRVAKEKAAPIAVRLIDSGFAALPAKSKPGDWKVNTIISSVAAKALLEWFTSKTGQNVLRHMNRLGISPKGEAVSVKKAADAHSGPLAGKTLVVTGTLSTMSRDDAFEQIRTAGGSVANKVSGKTDFLVVGENAGSKLKEAEKLGVKTLTEKQFLELVGAILKDGEQPNLFKV